MPNPGDGHDPASTDLSRTDTAGLSRRSLIRSAVGVGAATVAAGFLATALAEPAAAATSTESGTPAAHTEPVVAHVRDARTGQIDLFVGTRHVQIRDHDLAARLTGALR